MNKICSRVFFGKNRHYQALGQKVVNNENFTKSKLLFLLVSNFFNVRINNSMFFAFRGNAEDVLTGTSDSRRCRRTMLGTFILTGTRCGRLFE